MSTETGKSFTFIKETKILAQDTGFDGFYMALFERKINN
jgi:16S rRNA (cytosine967-C5)-methyltransferase